MFDVIAAPAGSLDPAASSELSIEVTAALRQLPHDQQVALVLVDMLDYAVAEAAEVLGVAEGTVKSRCARGRARLLPKLAHLRQRQGEGRPATQGSAPPGTVGPATPGSVGPPQPREPGYTSEADHRSSGNRFGSGSVLPGREGGDEAQ